MTLFARRTALLIAAFLMLVVLVTVTASVQSATPKPFRALSGRPAAEFKLPDDVDLVQTVVLEGYDLTLNRYQQRYDGSAEVLGGQLTVFTDQEGVQKLVIGAHFAGLLSSNKVNLTAAEARAAAPNENAPAGLRQSKLMINPESGRYFYWIETFRPDSRWIHWVDAANGTVVHRFNALTESCGSTAAPCGFGVEYDNSTTTDIKDLTGLTTLSGGTYYLQSADNRQETHDQGSSRRPFLGPVATDNDDSWVILGDSSPAQQALVDAHYYANLTDDYFLDQHGFDWVAAASSSGISRMVVHGHYSASYNNAFWNGSYIAIGDGDQVSFRELSSLDVIGHELTHAVTDFTSDLIYQNESGALNEAFSDMMGSSMEFYAATYGLEPAVTFGPDWLIGEDFDLRGDLVPGFRNMADPEEDGDPDHYSERYTGTEDNGGVHINSGIANQAFYLMTVGGMNASCQSPATHNSAHCIDGDTQDNNLSVTGIGVAASERIMFLTFTGLGSNATMCEARLATEAAAAALYGSASVEAASASNGWVAAGLTDAVCGITPQPTPTPTEPAATPTPLPPTPTPTDPPPTPTTAPPTPTEPPPTPTSVPPTPTPVPPTPTPTTPPPATTTHIGDLDGSSAIANRNFWAASVVILVHDSSEGPLSGATVTGTWADGTVSSCLTGSDGTCTVAGKKARLAVTSKSFTVDSISYGSDGYEPALNHDPETDSNGTVITVLRP